MTTLPLEELQSLLNQETQVLIQVESQMQTKKECLVYNRTTELMQADQALMALGQKTSLLEQQRMQLLQTMGFSDQSLETVIQDLRSQHPAQARQLEQTRQTMRRILANIQALNRNNKELLALSIQWIESTVELIARKITPEGASYTATGQKRQKRQHGAETLNIQSTVVHDA